ncbi:MAG: hypothetical protein AAGD25_39080 [Cyanobacteria bacterium P01_F01_bin.150]
MVDQLNAHIQNVQDSSPHSPEWEAAIAQLANTMLKRRPVCRPRSIKQLGAVYGDVKTAAKQQLQQMLTDFFSAKHRVPTLVQQWANGLMQQAFRDVLQESALCAIAIDAQQYQPRSPKWQLAVGELFQALLLSNRLTKAKHLTADQQNDAFNKTTVWVINHLQDFDPERGTFLGWINYRLAQISIELKGEVTNPINRKGYGKMIRTRRVLKRLALQIEPSHAVTWLWCQCQGGLPDHELIWYVLLLLLILLELAQVLQTYASQPEDYKEFLTQCMTILLNRPTQVPIASIEAMHDHGWDVPEAENKASELFLLKENLNQLIERDPDGLFSKHIKKHPKATFAAILLGRLENESLKSLSHRLGPGIPAINAFFQRNLKLLQERLIT